MNWILVFLGGFFGSVSRFAVSQWIGRYTATVFPVATMVINVTGCLVIGILLAEPHLAPRALLLLDIGFTGAFTTFSTFTFETIRLLEEGEWGMALLNPVLSVGLGMALVAAGSWLGQVIA